MRIGIPNEVLPGERRVAGTPDTVGLLIKMGFDVSVESGAGTDADYTDAAFADAGATIVASTAELWSSADLIIKVNPPTETGDGGHELDAMKEGAVLVSLIQPAQNEALLERANQKKISLIALEQIPRISRAQKMDVLSSMANIAGYRAVLEAAHVYGRFFGGQITAAGRTPPAKVLVIGAGVAGLAAVATARAMGAEVRSFDVRPACKEQVESLGAKFLMLEFEDEGGETAGGYAKTMSEEFIAAEMALFADQAKEVDIIITTALIPGRKAPLLITKEMVDTMRAGGVIVDLAAGQGGNCGYSEADKVIEVNSVSVIGYTDLTSRLPNHASQFFGRNIVALLDDMTGDDGFAIDLEDVVVRTALVTHEGETTWPPPKPPPAAVPATPKPVAAKPADVPKPAAAKKSDGNGGRIFMGLVLAVMFGAIGMWAPADFVQHFTVFVLACFIGWQVVWNVTPALHTPLMSVTNAISGIIVVGGILQGATGKLDLAVILGGVAILVASINIAGGFLVTQRMLQMFRRGGN